jgi:hypothetical protein
MYKTFDFGKIAYLGTRKINRVTVGVRLELRSRDNKLDTNLNLVSEYYTFSASGEIWNSVQSDCLSCGQNLDEIKLFVRHPNFIKLHRFWKDWHLNDMITGTELQSKALEDSGINFCGSCGYTDFDKKCAYLRTVNLYVDRGYTYGSEWLVRIIPDSIVEEIKTLLNEVQNA